MALDVSPPRTIGSAIRAKRRDAELSQRELGRLVGRSQQWVAAIEGDRYLPSIDHVRLLARHLKCRPADLFSGEEKMAS